jgi:hypothetical protein
MIGQNRQVVSRNQIPEIEHVVLETLEGKRRNKRMSSLYKHLIRQTLTVIKWNKP